MDKNNKKENTSVEKSVKSLTPIEEIHFGFDLDKSLAAIKDYIRSLEEERDRAVEKVCEWNKDAEIQAAYRKRDELKKMFKHAFCIPEEEWDAAQIWMKKHSTEKHVVHKEEDYMKHPRKFYPEEAYYRYWFTPTPIGTICSVVCLTCRQKAFKKSKGDLNKYRKLMDAYEANFFIGEV